ncbi:hypothetical protein AB0N09_27855 [Streptomyces erythrochromogenes]|uniref:hypothetical protein n=1 Tax=Streptomyces erythrochromogenes TaxID=285574 RepID=UPI0034296A12
MSDGYDDLAKTMQTVELLLEQTGLDRSSVLNLKELAHQTSLSEKELRTLLAGKKLPPIKDFDAEVVRRIKFLQATRLREVEGPGGTTYKKPYSSAAIAQACGMTPAWLSALLAKPKAPNLDHSAHLADFFKVPVGFLTDQPAKGLARVLNDIVIPHLGHFKESPTEATVNRHAVKIAHRLGDTKLSRDQEAAFMVFIDSVVASARE